MDPSEPKSFKEIREAPYCTRRSVAVAAGAKKHLFTANWVEALQAWTLPPNKQAGFAEERTVPCGRAVSSGALGRDLSCAQHMLAG